jgi:hypothetical protein
MDFYVARGVFLDLVNVYLISKYYLVASFPGSPLNPPAYSHGCVSSRFACLTFDLDNEQIQATLLSANEVVCGQGLEAC